MFTRYSYFIVALVIVAIHFSTSPESSRNLTNGEVPSVYSCYRGTYSIKTVLGPYLIANSTIRFTRTQIGFYRVLIQSQPMTENSSNGNIQLQFSRPYISGTQSVRRSKSIFAEATRLNQTAL